MSAFRTLFSLFVLFVAVSAVIEAPSYDRKKDRECLEKLRLWFKCLREKRAKQSLCTQYYCELVPYPSKYTTTVRNMRAVGVKPPKGITLLMPAFVPDRNRRFTEYEIPVLDDSLADCTKQRYNLCYLYYNKIDKDAAAEKCMEFLHMCKRERFTVGLKVKHRYIETDKLQKLDYPKPSDDRETCRKKREVICKYKFPQQNPVRVSADQQKRACEKYMDNCPR